jgi:hypothetical protein
MKKEDIPVGYENSIVVTCVAIGNDLYGIRGLAFRGGTLPPFCLIHDPITFHCSFRAPTLWSQGDSFEPCLPIKDVSTSVPLKNSEVPCGGCGRMNDVGVKVCWCCGSSP